MTLYHIQLQKTIVVSVEAGRYSEAMAAVSKLDDGGDNDQSWAKAGVDYDLVDIEHVSS